MRSDVRFEIVGEDIEKEHFHQDIELIYVLEGSVAVSINEERWDLKKGDIILINANKIHKLKGNEVTLLCKIYIDYFFVSEILQKDYIIFWCNTLIENDKQYDKLKNIINSMLREGVSQHSQNSFLQKSLQYSLLECLSKEFLVQTSDQWAESEEKKIGQVLEYINFNYNRTITLSEVATKLYMSDSSFSRFFKKSVGINFVEYINNVRLTRAVELLLYSDKSITTIALECGFSNPSAFNKIFKEYYKVSPTTYKKENGKIKIKKLNNIDEISEKKIKKYLEEQNIILEVNKNSSENIKVDISKISLNESMGKSCFNFGMAIDLLHAKLREQLVQLKNKIGIEYIRICNPFHPGMYIKDNNGLEWNFDSIDNIFDFIVANDIHPVIDLANKPKRASRYVGKDIFYDEQSNIPIYSSLDEWQSLISEFIKHIIHRYGEREIRQWIFELWYDENWFEENKGTTTYMNLWDLTYSTIKSIMPEIKIGGNGLHIFHKGDILKEHLKIWKNSKHRPDFLTTYIYPYSNDTINEDICIQRSTDEVFLETDLRLYNKLLKEIEYPDTEVYITEWNTCLSERNYYNDSCAKAAHVVKQVINTWGESGLISYWHACDLLGHYFDGKAPLVGSTGLITRDGIEKPVFFAYYFLQQLGEYIIERGENHIITTDGKNNYYILICNAKRFNHNYYIKREDEITIDDLENIFEDKASIDLEIQLKGIKSGEYYVKKHRLNEKSGSIIREWKNLGCIYNLKKSEIEYMKSMCTPRMEISKKVAQHSMLAFNTKLLANEIAFIHIYQ